MADIDDIDFSMMDIEPERHPVLVDLDEAMVAASAREVPRTYLGASIAGTLCARSLWYTVHAPSREDFPPFILRRFETGHQMEARVVRYLRGAGYEVIDSDALGRQYRADAYDGRLQGHVDGFIRGRGLGTSWRLLEVKAMVQAKYVRDVDSTPTRNKTSGATEGRWFSVRKHGVQKAELTHYCQMQVYMGLSRTAGWPVGELHRALYLAVGTDTEHIYAEDVAYRDRHYRQIMDRARRILDAEDPPPRISENPASWDCRYCRHRDTCHGASS